MLQDIRDNSQGTIAKIIVAAVIISLALFGIDAIVGGFGGEPAVATVNDTDITEQEFQRAVQLQRQQILRQMERPDPALLDEGAINRAVLDNLIDQTLLYQDAVDRGLELSEAEIDRLITSMPVFQVDGRFSQERFMNLVRNQGMSIQQLREALRRDYLIRQIQLAVAAGAFAAPQAAENLLALQQQRRDLSTLSLDASLVADEVTVSDEEVAEYYDANGEQFMLPESVDVAWIELDRDALAETVEVSEEDVRALYQRRIDEMEAREERRVAHILVTDAEGEEAAEQEIADIQAALAEGQDFAELAKTYSDDPGSASNGGDLGFATREAFDEKFADALFQIEEVGDVVGPIETSFGYHFIKLLDKRTQEKPGFRELRDNLRAELAAEKAGRLYNEKSARLADISYSAFDLQEPAAEIGAEVKTTEGVTREGNEPPFDHPGLIRQLFSEDVLEKGNNSELVEVAEGRAVVARVQEHHPAQAQPLAAVEDEIREQLRAEKEREALNALAAKWIAEIEQGADPAEVTSSATAEWVEQGDVQRDSGAVPPAVLASAFRLPHPESGPVYGTAETPSGVTLIQLNNVETPDVEENDPALERIQGFLAQQQAAQASASYLEALRANAEITRP